MTSYWVGGSCWLESLKQCEDINWFRNILDVSTGHIAHKLHLQPFKATTIKPSKDRKPSKIQIWMEESKNDFHSVLNSLKKYLIFLVKFRFLVWIKFKIKLFKVNSKFSWEWRVFYHLLMAILWMHREDLSYANSISCEIIRSMERYCLSRRENSAQQWVLKFLLLFFNAEPWRRTEFAGHKKSLPGH